MRETGEDHAPAKRFPTHGHAGVVLVLLLWALNWTLPGLRTHLLFFPLWLGYCLTVDGLAVASRGSSLLTRSRAGYVSLFLVSAPAWWLFEAINLRTHNWLYLGREQFSDLEYFLLASLSFSTVIPAVFGTAEWVRGWSWIERLASGPKLAGPGHRRAFMFVSGWLGLALLLLWPRYFFPLVWVSIWLILEPINAWRGHPTLLGPLERGDWRPLLSMALGGLMCGFFWELWNLHAYPKWTYRVPYVDFLRVFEMPLLGYLGYIPFAFELYALYHLVSGLASDRYHDYLWV